VRTLEVVELRRVERVIAAPAWDENQLRITGSVLLEIEPQPVASRVRDRENDSLTAPSRKEMEATRIEPA
jgi:hypothetical protein